MPLVPIPLELPALPTIEGNVDYLEFRQNILRIDQLLLQGHVEEKFIADCFESRLNQSGRRPTAKAQLNFQIHSRRALRCNIARTLLNEDFRGFSTRLADSPLLQHFCGVAQLDRVKVPSKSTLQRYSQWVGMEAIEQTVHQLITQAHEHPRQLQLKQAVDLDALFLDTTCVKANIHYPVDWVLMRDATRTLMQTVVLIRNQGIVHRMEDPESFISRMNKECIKMTHCRGKSDSKRHRKTTFRAMDKLVDTVAKHARRYRDLLDQYWEQTEWTRPQSEQALQRLDSVLEQLPAARAQARQRIIKEQQVESREKILSLYDPDVNVIVRNKAGAEVEFGNTLLIGESRQGLILDWKLFQGQAPGDAKLAIPSLIRTQENLNCTIQEVGADRGFDSASNRQNLAGRNVYNGICPKDPKELRRRIKSEKFSQTMKRRSQTEGRIAILKNVLLGSPLRSKGFEHRQRSVGWAVLTHNLWVIARLPKRKLKATPVPLDKAA